MMDYLPALLILAMLLTLGALGFGLVTMVRGRSDSSLSRNERANRLMRLRVGMQFVALAVFAALILLLKR